MIKIKQVTDWKCSERRTLPPAVMKSIFFPASHEKL